MGAGPDPLITRGHRFKSVPATKELLRPQIDAQCLSKLLGQLSRWTGLHYEIIVNTDVLQKELPVEDFKR